MTIFHTEWLLLLTFLVMFIWFCFHLICLVYFFFFLGFFSVSFLFGFVLFVFKSLLACPFLSKPTHSQFHRRGGDGDYSGHCWKYHWIKIQKASRGRYKWAYFFIHVLTPFFNLIWQFLLFDFFSALFTFLWFLLWIPPLTITCASLWWRMTWLDSFYRCNYCNYSRRRSGC